MNTRQAVVELDMAAAEYARWMFENRDWVRKVGETVGTDPLTLFEAAAPDPESIPGLRAALHIVADLCPREVFSMGLVFAGFASKHLDLLLSEERRNREHC